jgi:hypothetical protein
LPKFSDVPKFILDNFFEYLLTPKSTPNTFDPTEHTYLYGGERTIRSVDPLDPFTFVGPKQGMVVQTEPILFYLLVEKIIYDEDHLDGYVNVYKIPFYPLIDEFSEDFYAIRREINLETAATSGMSIDPGSRTWFYKGNELHNYILDVNNDIHPDVEYKDRFVNANKIALYFGKIYNKDEEEHIYKVEHESLYNFVIDALPQHNRTDNLQVALRTYFDQVHSEIYNLMKNVNTLIDPYEIDFDFIDNIADLYSITINQNLSEEEKREFVANIINFLKRKGSYSSLFILFRTFLPTTTNKFRVYERWHEDNAVYPLDFIPVRDFNYRDFYGNNTMPKEYPPYPVNVFKDFNYLNYYGVTMPTDGCSGDLYSNSGYVHGHSGLLIPNENCWIFKQQNRNTEWTVMHPLREMQPIIRCYNEKLEWIKDVVIQSVQPYMLKVTMSTPQKGYALIAKPAPISKRITASAENWTYNHGINQIVLVSEYYNYELNDDPIPIPLNTIYDPDDVYAKDNNNFYASDTDAYRTYNVACSASALVDNDVLSSTWTVDHNLENWGVIIDIWTSKESSVWTIAHSLYSKSVIVQCYNTDRQMIFPTKVEVLGENELRITFAEPHKGFALILKANDSQSYSYSSIWTYNHHYSDRYLMTQYYDIDTINQKIFTRYPDMLYVEEAIWPTQLTTTFSTSGDGYQYSASASYIEEVWKVSDTWEIDHLLDTFNIITQFYLMMPAKIWKISHTLNTKNLVVQCFNFDYQLMRPADIRIMTEGYVEIEFASPAQGFVVMSESEYEGQNIVITSLNSGGISHSLGTTEVIPHFRYFDETYLNTFIPDEVSVNSTTDIGFVNDENVVAFSTEVLLISGDYTYYQEVKEDIWYVGHSYATQKDLTVQVYSPDILEDYIWKIPAIESTIIRLYNDSNVRIGINSGEILEVDTANSFNYFETSFTTKQAGYVSLATVDYSVII